MRRTIPFLMVIAILWSCGGSEAELNPLQARVDSLETANSNQQSEIDYYLADFMEIQKVMDSVKSRQAIIAARGGSPELSSNTRANLTNDLLELETLLNEGKAKIELLKKEVSQSKKNMKSLQALIDNLQKKLDEKDGQIVVLKKELEKVNVRVQTVERSYDSLAISHARRGARIEQQTEVINTVFWATGSYSVLKDKKVISPGGFLNARSGARISSDFNQDYFKSADRRKLTEIPIGTRNIHFATNHPSSAYELVKTDFMIEKLVITDPEAFWSSSRYLVIILD
jgi:hypothetical protein